MWIEVVGVSFPFFLGFLTSAYPCVAVFIRILLGISLESTYRLFVDFSLSRFLCCPFLVQAGAMYMYAQSGLLIRLSFHVIPSLNYLGLALGRS